MQEEEAEIALLALGGMLEWEAGRPASRRPLGFVREVARLESGAGYQSYTVELHPEYSSQVKVWVSYRISDAAKRLAVQNGELRHRTKHYYNTIAEAKAACEIHAATGQFPPSVEPPLAAPVEVPVDKEQSDCGSV